MHILVWNILTCYHHIPSWDVSPWGVIVRLHGRQQNDQTFSVLINQLQHYHHYTLDLPGFWHTPLPPTSRSVPEYAQYVSSFIEKMQIDCSHLTIVWHSFGWRIGIEMVSKKLITPRGLILIWAAGIQQDTHTSLSVIKHFIISVAKLLWHIPGGKQLYSSCAKRFRSSDYNTAWPLTDIFLQTISYDQTPLLEKIQAPTLLIRWDQDDQTPLKQAELMHTRIPWSQLSVFAGGHFIYLEQPQVVLETIENFLSF